MFGVFLLVVEFSGHYKQHWNYECVFFCMYFGGEGFEPREPDMWSSNFSQEKKKIPV